MAGPATHVNVRAFKSGMLSSITNGALVPLNYGLGRMAPGAGNVGPAGHAVGALNGRLDSVTIGPSGVVTVSGWAVDTLGNGAGAAPVTVLVMTTQPLHWQSGIGQTYKSWCGARRVPRFAIELLGNASKQLLSPGKHIVIVKAIGTPSTTIPMMLPGASFRRCVDGNCDALMTSQTSF